MAFKANGMKLILAAMLASAAVAVALASAPTSSIKSKYLEFSYVMHAYGFGPNVTGYDLLNPLPGLEETHFGQLRAFDAKIRKTEALDSEYLGQAVGYVLYDSLNKTGVDLFWCSYFYGAQGQAVDLDGLIVESNSGLCYRGYYYSGAASWEKIVVGGTGSFRFCKGYTVETPIAEDATTGLETYNIKAHLLCDRIITYDVQDEDHDHDGHGHGHDGHGHVA